MVSHADYAADCPNPAVKIEAVGGAYGSGGWFHRDDFPKMASSEAAAEMWSRTDLTPSDVDVAEIYDGFTFLTFAWLEALGFCGDGEAGPFVEGATRIALDGDATAQHVRGTTVRGTLAWLLAVARGVPAVAWAGRGPSSRATARGGGRRGRWWSDRRLHGADLLTQGYIVRESGDGAFQIGDCTCAVVGDEDQTVEGHRQEAVLLHPAQLQYQPV